MFDKVKPSLNNNVFLMCFFLSKKKLNHPSPSAKKKSGFMNMPLSKKFKPGTQVHSVCVHHGAGVYVTLRICLSFCK